VRRFRPLRRGPSDASDEAEDARQRPVAHLDDGASSRSVTAVETRARLRPPVAPALDWPLNLNRGRTWPIGRDGTCFACHCLPDFPCRDDCTISDDPVIGQLLCTRCRAQHSPDVWQQLAAVAPASPGPGPGPCTRTGSAASATRSASATCRSS
jgi:hypothetical protein